MQSSHTDAPRHPRNEAARFAFTLLELLIVISIIAIMAGLILTVAGSASIKAHNAQVAADVQSLSAGIAAFKQRFGVEPPSRIVLYEYGSGNGPNVAPFTAANPADDWGDSDGEVSRSMGLIRQIWPQFDFTLNRDINGDGDTTDTITLSGAECLVFFLGGPPNVLLATTPATQGGPPMGFSQNPSDPFSRVGTTNRLSFTELSVNRLLWYQATQPNRMNTYVDTLSGQTQPYLYLSSYGGQGYNVNELVGAPPIGPNLGNAPGGNSPAGNAFVDVYRQDSQSYWASTSPFTPNPNTPSPAWNANSFQIISPGGDHQYGTGGEYESGDPKGLLVGTRGGERDNITNFSSGVLVPE